MVFEKKLKKVEKFFRSDKCCPRDNGKTKSTQKEVAVDLRASSITADILNVLSDGKKHTMQEIADVVEVSERTVRRHIQSLSYRYPIETFCGGIERGGVRLDRKYCYGDKILTREENETIRKALKLLQESENDKTIENLLKIF